MKYLEGYSKALDAVQGMTQEELIEQLGALWGTGKLKFGASLEDIRREAIRQTKLDFLDASADDYRQSQKMLENW